MKILALGAFLWKSFVLFFFVVIVTPIRFILQQILLPVAIWMYKGYLPVKQSVQRFLIPAKNSWVYVFTTRYILHIIVVVLTLVVTTNNLMAKEVHVEEFGRGTVISNFVTSDSNQEIIETGVQYTVPSSYQSESAALAAYVSPTNDVFVSNISGSGVQIDSTGGALVRQDVIDTSRAGTPREGVIEYTVLGGDTISTIASAHGVSTNTLLWANNLSATSYIKPGQHLKIPPVSGVVHTVASGDTVEKIATKYKAKSADILAFNLLPAPEAIEVGQSLVVPGGEIEPPKPVVVASSGRGAEIAQSGDIPSAPVSGTKLQWPTPSRRINQYFRYRHTGVDIDGNRSPVYAAESGVVKSAGWSGGYGLSIVIDHGGGLQTLYGHFSSIRVRVGDRVGRGDGIGITGCTGWCTGDHLHFEVIVSGRKTNPLGYL